MIREKHNKGRESGDKVTKRYGRRENGVREAGDCDPPFPPLISLMPIVGFFAAVSRAGCNGLSVESYVGLLIEERIFLLVNKHERFTQN